MGSKKIPAEACPPVSKYVHILHTHTLFVDEKSIVWFLEHSGV